MQQVFIQDYEIIYTNECVYYVIYVTNCEITFKMREKKATCYGMAC